MQPHSLFVSFLLFGLTPVLSKCREGFHSLNSPKGSEYCHFYIFLLAKKIGNRFDNIKCQNILEHLDQNALTFFYLNEN